jgi:outer membrane protein
MKPDTLVRGLMAAGLLLVAAPVMALTVNLQQAIEMSLAADPRIKEREQLVEVARGMLQEVQGNAGWRVSANAFIGLTRSVEGGFFEGGEYSGTIPRSDGDDFDGLSDWTRLEFALIKPLYTFGKIERYGEAAQGNIDLKRGELKQTRGDIVYDTKRAYFGHLTARDIRHFLEDMQSRLDKVISGVERELQEETGESKHSDLYALQSARGLISKYAYPGARG